MGNESAAGGPKEVLRTVWAAAGADLAEVCEPAGEGKICRNMAGVSFEGMVADGTDLRSAWRAKLDSEGKLARNTVHDLIFDRDDVERARTQARALSARSATAN